MIAWMIAAAVCAQIAPEPLSAEVDQDERIELRPGTYVVFADEEAATAAGWFDALNAAANGGLLRTTASRYREKDFAVYVGVTGQHPLFRERRQRRWLQSLPPAGVQGYRLLIDRRGVLLAGTDHAGIVNGIATLLQLFRDDGTLPEARVRDEPEIAIRAIRLQGRPDAARIRELADTRCNLAIIESPDWWNLTNQTAQQWRAKFTELRASGIEPIPAIDPSGNIGPFIARFPGIAQTQAGIDQLVVTDDAWSPLSRRNIIESPSSPIRARAEGRYFEAGRDFVIAPPQSGGEDNAWYVRRVADGGIAPGTSIDVLYNYAPADTGVVDPLIPAYPDAIRKVVSEIVRAVEPETLHIGHGNFEPADRGVEPDPLAESLKAFVDATNGKVRLVADADTFRDKRRANVMDLLPRDAMLEVRAPYGPPAIGNADTIDVSPFRNVAQTLMISAPDSPLAALATCENAARSQNIAGIVADDPDVVRMAWSPARSRLPWPRVLNAYFEARLWKPGDIEAFEALAAHANAQTVRGVRPETELETFRHWFDANHDRLPEADATFVEGHYTRILEWIRLESEFHRGEGRNTLRDLIDLVQRHATAIPEYPEERRSTIVHTIDSAGRFVPSNILFGTPVLACRAVNLPDSLTVLEVPVRPEFTDNHGATEATFDLLESPGPIFRIDFDTLTPTAISVERSLDGNTFESVQRWGGERTTPAGPPLFMQRAFSAAAFRVTVEGNPPILRDPRVFALKEVPAAICSQSAIAPALDGQFRERCWPSEAQIAGFVESAQARFAAVATTVRVTYTRDALYLGVYAREPRMETMVSEITSHDGPLWTEEAIDIRMGVGNDQFIFVAGPNGTRFDSRNDDANWDGAWSVQTRRFTTGWSAEVELPFETLGARPRSGEDWAFDVVRYRCNVERSTSHWAYRPGSDEGYEPGRLIFN